MNNIKNWWDIDLQLFGGEGAAGDGGGEGGSPAASGESAPVAGDARLRELGVPESKLRKHRASREKAAARKSYAENQTAHEAKDEAAAKTQTEQAAAAEETAPNEGSTTEAPTRMSWDEIMADPEYNKQMQSVIQARLKKANSAKEMLDKLTPSIELLARKYGLDAKNLDAEALSKAISDDDAYYEEKAVEMGVPVDVAKRIDQNEREMARRQEEEARTIEEQKMRDHFERLERQGEAMKAAFPNFNLEQELQNPAFLRMTSPNVGISVEDAYYAVHRKEIQQAAMQVTAQKTAQQMANAIRAGQSRPVENGSKAQAPSVSTFDYATASKEQREALKRKIYEAKAHGKKLYPGQF